MVASGYRSRAARARSRIRNRHGRASGIRARGEVFLQHAREIPDIPVELRHAANGVLQFADSGVIQKAQIAEVSARWRLRVHRNRLATRRAEKLTSWFRAVPRPSIPLEWG